MKKTIIISVLILLFMFPLFLSAQEKTKKWKRGNDTIDMRIDNMGYWRKMAEKGYIPYTPYKQVENPIYKSSIIEAKSVRTVDALDIAVNNVYDEAQSENSISVHPNNNSIVLNSNNSVKRNTSGFSQWHGADYFSSNDYGETWEGSIEGAGSENAGDPATAINYLGMEFIGYINATGGQTVATRIGSTWYPIVAADAAPQVGLFAPMLDKNHLWIDNTTTSPYKGNIYNAWFDAGGYNDGEICLVSSTNNGSSYSEQKVISAEVSAGTFNHGVNINTGPNGEVYAVWAIYDNWEQYGYEEAIGFAKSTDGGETFEPAKRIATNIHGIRATTPKWHRLNSFPSMTVDINTGIIFVVWTNVGEPGINTGTNASIYLIKSSDGGNTWTNAKRINNGPKEDNKYAYFPWITCDTETSVLSVIFYDDRNVADTQTEAWVANSYDDGENWENFRVSDVAFTSNSVRI